MRVTTQKPMITFYIHFIMRKYTQITIPEKYEDNDVDHLSDYPILDNLLDQGKVILDKVIPGCGATEYYLRLPGRPVILTAPLNLLLESKLDLNPTDEELKTGNYDPTMKRSNKVYYFNRSDDTVSLDKSREDLCEYLQNKSQLPDFVPKIMVSYDSFCKVCDTLQYLQCLDAFTIVVDEFPSIFQYVGLPQKGHIFLNFLERLNALNNHVVYLTATPVEDKYLNSITGFQNIPYYTLVWDPDKIQKVRIYPIPIKSVTEKMLEIVNRFRTEGCFRKTLDADMKLKKSTEGIFFLNNVSDIVKIINTCKLTSKEVLILCARNIKNEAKLKKIDSSLGKFHIGKPAPEWNYRKGNKQFTFVTSVAFLGVDMHSDCSSTYVFANGNIPSLSLDISIDLPQIAGRCRTNQPFKDDIDMFYVNSSQKVIDKAKVALQQRVAETDKMLSAYSNMSDMAGLQTILDAQKSLCYTKYYLDVKELGNGKGKAVINETAYQSQLRAIDIKENQLLSDYTVSRFISRTAKPTLSSSMYSIVYAFFIQYRNFSDFVSRMKLYVDTLEAYPSIKSYIEQYLTNVDIEYKQFYNTLGPEEIRKCGYRKLEIEKRISELNRTHTYSSDIVTRCYELMPKGSRISKKDVKRHLNQIYSEFGLTRNAKSTDLQEWGIPVREIKISQNNKRVDGYEFM